MEDDFNHNGKADGPYDSYLDTDPQKTPVGDFKLMLDMGVNAIRLYHHPMKINKEVLRDMYKTYGIRVIMGDFLGKYALGSGAAWNPGTDYNNEEQKKNMLASVRQMVNEYKDEPFILFWLLGNENVYGYACNANTEPDAFFKFANEVAKEIKAIDPNHPVAIGSGDILFLDKFGKDAPDIDIFGANAYRGEYGFGRLWKSVKEEADKPVFITEFGCPAYAEGKTPQEAESLQAEYHQGSWQDITGLSRSFSASTIVSFMLSMPRHNVCMERWSPYLSTMRDGRPSASECAMRYASEPLTVFFLYSMHAARRPRQNPASTGTSS